MIALLALSAFLQDVRLPPFLDLDGEVSRQVVVDREKGQYLGHPTTALLEDGKTILCVYPKGHGKGPILYQKSVDGGRTWSGRLITPANWVTSQETPTIHRVTGADGKKRLILFSGLYPARIASSEDDGATWTELAPLGDWGGIVVMGSVEAVRGKPGHLMAFFHDDGRFFRKGGKATGIFTLLQTRSEDAGRTWSEPKSIQTSGAVHLCEPGSVRSPDGKDLALLLRENRRQSPSQFMLTRDEGQTWESPKPLHPALFGDRHTARQAPDGRLVISFRDVPPKGTNSLTAGDWVAWVGTFDDIIHGRPGQAKIRLKKNHKGGDCAYPGVELLPDGTFVLTTYGHWTPGEPPYILSVRLKLDEVDSRVGVKPAAR